MAASRSPTGAPPCRRPTPCILELAGDLAEVIDAATASGLVARPDVFGTGPVALLATVTGSAEEPVVAADLEVAGGSRIVTGSLPAATAVELRAHVGDGSIDLFTATARWQEGLFTSSGRVPVRLIGPSTCRKRCSTRCPRPRAMPR